MISRKCEICNNGFDVRFPSSKKRTCSKPCKNVLAHKNMIEYNKEYPDNAAHRGELLQSYKQTDSYKRGMARRDFRGENHPSYGKERSATWRQRISESNKGKSLGRTWEERFGVEVAQRRRSQNAEAAALTNQRLLTDRTSEVERALGMRLRDIGYDQNIRIGKYTVDFINRAENTIIEVYGDYWHCNPAKYAADYYNRSIKMMAQDKWDYDTNRITHLRDNGFDVIVLWEQEAQNMTMLAEDAIKAAIEDYRSKCSP